MEAGGWKMEVLMVFHTSKSLASLEVISSKLPFSTQSWLISPFQMLKLFQLFLTACIFKLGKLYIIISNQFKREIHKIEHNPH